MNVEQKRDMVIKGYNPTDPEDVNKYLNGIPKHYGYQKENLGGASMADTIVDETGATEIINEANSSRLKQQPKIDYNKPTVTNRITESDDPFADVLGGGGGNNKEQGFKDGISYLLAFVEAMKTGKRKDALIKLNNVIKKRATLGESYEKGLREAEIKLLKKFNG
jgi:hypothetical protein